MANAPRESFIPRKTTTPKTSRSRVKKRAIGVFGYVSYITFGGALLLAGGMLFLSFQVDNTLASQEEELQAVQNEFQDSDLAQVQAYERFMNTVQMTFDESVSFSELFTNIEESIVERAVITSLDIERSDDVEGYRVTAEVLVDTFDSALFQRDLYAEYSLLESYVVNDVILVEDGLSMLPEGDDDDGDEESGFSSAALNEMAEAAAAGGGAVTFSLTMSVAADSLPFEPSSVPPEGTTVFEEEEVEEISPDVIDEGEEFNEQDE